MDVEFSEKVRDTRFEILELRNLLRGLSFEVLEPRNLCLSSFLFLGKGIASILKETNRSSIEVEFTFDDKEKVGIARILKERIDQAWRWNLLL